MYNMLISLLIMLISSFTICCANAEVAALLPGLELDAAAFAKEFVQLRQIKAELILDFIKQRELKDPPEELERYLPETKMHIERFAPGFLAEFAAFDQELALAKGTYLRFLVYRNSLASKKPECTTWILMPEICREKQVLLHKNRDSSELEHAPLWRHSPGKLAWLLSHKHAFSLDGNKCRRPGSGHEQCRRL